MTSSPDTPEMYAFALAMLRLICYCVVSVARSFSPVQVQLYLSFVEMGSENEECDVYCKDEMKHRDKEKEQRITQSVQL